MGIIKEAGLNNLLRLLNCRVLKITGAYNDERARYVEEGGIGPYDSRIEKLIEFQSILAMLISNNEELKETDGAI